MLEMKCQWWKTGNYVWLVQTLHWILPENNPLIRPYICLQQIMMYNNIISVVLRNLNCLIATSVATRVRSMFFAKTDVDDLEVELLLAIGAMFMLTSNICTYVGRINGALGVV